MIQIATFQTNITPVVGDPLEYGKTETIEDNISFRGVVLLTNDLPIILAAADWFGNFNGGYDTWRIALAEAAETSPKRVAVHTLHQHEAPGFDTNAMDILFSNNTDNKTIGSRFAYKSIRHAAEALGQTITTPQKVTHIGIGVSEVEDVASNRELLGPDGDIHYIRHSSDTNPEARSLPEGVIDSRVRIISFWDNEQPLAALSYYATHPMSYYGDRAVTCDFVGLARNRVEETIGVPLIHFTGAAGNVTAGKYNDGSHESREKLTQRLTEGMIDAWKSTERHPITTDDIKWHVQGVTLPVADWLDREPLVKAISKITDPRFLSLHDLGRRIPKLTKIAGYLSPNPSARIRKNHKYVFRTSKRLGLQSTALGIRENYPHVVQMARDLAWLHRCELGHEIPLSCLELGNVRILNLPGEPFVEYQLAASEMRPELTVAVAAYGDSGPFYIGTRDQYTRGGFGVDGIHSKVSPKVEDVLVSAIRNLLEVSENTEITTPSEITAKRKPRVYSSDL